MSEFCIKSILDITFWCCVELSRIRQVFIQFISVRDRYSAVFQKIFCYGIKVIHVGHAII